MTNKTRSPVRRKETILMIEDSPVQVAVLQRVLRNADFEVLVAYDGEDGLQQAQASQPDLILLDIVMPGIDGLETCRRLKENEITCNIPVIFMTGISNTTNKVQGFKLGAVDYITKPIQADEVLARITTHLMLKNLQRDLQEQLLEREQLITELDAFSHMVAHDLKNPLYSMIGFAEMIDENWQRMSTEKIGDGLREIVRSGYKMQNIIDALLLLASVRRQEVETHPLHMSLIIAEVRARLVYMVEEFGAQISAPQKWPVACGYAPWVEEVWINYLSNAIKYGGDPPCIQVGAEAGLEGTVRFWVRDNGRGLTAEEQDQLFTPFTRLNQVQVKGHGLGLSIVRRIVEKLGGQVGVESKVGEGSLFYFTLPAP